LYKRALLEIFLFVFLVFVVLAVVNLLIAMFSQTYSNFQSLFKEVNFGSKSVLLYEAKNLSIFPCPFNILVLPTVANTGYIARAQSKSDQALKNFRRVVARKHLSSIIASKTSSTLPQLHHLLEQTKQRIVASEEIRNESKQPHGIVVMGAPGVGKSTFISRIIERDGSFVRISADDFLPAYPNLLPSYLRATMPPLYPNTWKTFYKLVSDEPASNSSAVLQQGEAIHKYGQQCAKDHFEEILTVGSPLVYERCGNFDNIKATVDALLAASYSVTIIYLDGSVSNKETQVNKAIEQNRKRIRSLNESTVRQKISLAAQAFKTLKEYCDNNRLPSGSVSLLRVNSNQLSTEPRKHEPWKESVLATEEISGQLISWRPIPYQHNT